jgi:hypothetical protein
MVIPIDLAEIRPGCPQERPMVAAAELSCTHAGATLTRAEAEEFIYREERVYRTLHTPVLDQNPRSRTVHMVGNVEVGDVDERGDVRVLCRQFVAEIHAGGQPRSASTRPGCSPRCGEYRLRDTADGWRMSLKKLMLVDADQQLYSPLVTSPTEEAT